MLECNSKIQRQTHFSLYKTATFPLGLEPVLCKGWTYLIVVVNLPELRQLLKIAPFKLRSVVEALPTEIICCLVQDQQGFGVSAEPGFFIPVGLQLWYSSR